jgi:hypothetical protein
MWCSVLIFKLCIAKSCLENLVVPNIHTAIVSILLTEKMILCLKYFIEMKCYVVCISNRQYVDYVFRDDFYYIQIC